MLIKILSIKLLSIIFLFSGGVLAQVPQSSGITQEQSMQAPSAMEEQPLAMPESSAEVQPMSEQTPAMMKMEAQPQVIPEQMPDVQPVPEQMSEEMKTVVALYFANFVYELYEKKLIDLIVSPSFMSSPESGSFREDFTNKDISYGQANYQRIKDYNPLAMAEEKETIKTGVTSPEKVLQPEIPLTPYLDQLGKDLGLENWIMIAIKGNTGVEIKRGALYEYQGPSEITVAKALSEQTSAVVAWHPVRKILVVATRGTTGSLDWLTNIALTGRPTKDVHTFAALIPVNARVPRGFLGYAHSMSNDIYRAIIKLVKNEDEPIAQVIITGHSLGGAAAAINGAWFASMAEISQNKALKRFLFQSNMTSKRDNIPSFKQENISLITFGMPGNVGNKPFVNWLDPRLGYQKFYHTPRDPVSKISTAYVPTLFGLFDQYVSGVSKHWQKVGAGPYFVEVPDWEHRLQEVKFHALTSYGKAILQEIMFPDFTRKLIEEAQSQPVGSEGGTQGETSGSAINY